MQDALSETVRHFQRPLVAWLYLAFESQVPWREARFHIKPAGQSVRALVTIDEAFTQVVSLPREQRDLADEWQRASYEILGTAWLTLGLIVTTLPSGRVHVECHYNYDKDPGSWGPDDAPFTGEDLAFHLLRFPGRAGRAVPDWMRERIVADGLVDPGPRVEGVS